MGESRVIRSLGVRMLATALAGGAAGCHTDDPEPPPNTTPNLCLQESKVTEIQADGSRIAVRGLATPGTQHIDIQIKDFSTNTYQTLDAGQIEGTSPARCPGALPMIAWSASMTLPTGRVYYQGAQSFNLIGVRALGTDDAGKSDGPEVTLEVACGATGTICCAPWDSSTGSAVEYGKPCTNTSAADCDRCDDGGALCDWDFACKKDLWPPDASAYGANITFPPPEIQEDWTWDVQGVATDGNDWYFTQGASRALSPTKGALYKIPFGTNLDQNFNPSTTGSAAVQSLSTMPDPYCWHWGDPEIYQGRLYVPMEDCTSGPNLIMEVDAATLTPLGTAPLEGLSAPTVAIHPSTREFFVTGPYDAASTTTMLRVFEAQPSSTDTPFTLTSDRDVGVFDSDGVTPLSLHIVQGLAFSPSGKLYVAAQGTNQDVYCLQVAPDKATLIERVHVEMNEGEDQEYEGMAAFDLGQDFKQIHLFTYQNASPPHQHGAWFKHISVDGIDTNPNRY